jgi:ABC-type phosphate/phosphonate transport system ATPase subunit
MAQKPRKRRRAKRGSIGVQIFEQVEKLVGEQKIGRTAAFRRLAEKTGRQQGTVAANYYRIARKRGTKLAPRRRRLGVGGAATSAVLRRALTALEDVTGLYRKLEDEIVELRKENRRLAAIRRLVGR